MREGKVTLTCGHSNVPPVGVWEPEIDREGNRCRSYSTYCPDCAERATLVMVRWIEALEAENNLLREAGQAVLGRFGTPPWNEAEDTGYAINRLRAALKKGEE